MLLLQAHAGLSLNVLTRTRHDTHACGCACVFAVSVTVSVSHVMHINVLVIHLKDHLKYGSKTYVPTTCRVTPCTTVSHSHVQLINLVSVVQLSVAMPGLVSKR